MTARIAPVPTPSTGNVLPLLNEIGHALDPRITTKERAE
jgi:hypothetical protein